MKLKEMQDQYWILKNKIFVIKELHEKIENGEETFSPTITRLTSGRQVEVTKERLARVLSELQIEGKISHDIDPDSMYCTINYVLLKIKITEDVKEKIIALL